jgi:hypothetical protein
MKEKTKLKNTLLNKWHFDPNHILTPYLAERVPMNRDIYVQGSTTNPRGNKKRRKAQ